MSDAGAQWQTIRSEALPAIKGAACRSKIPVAAAFGPQGAVVATESCTMGDGGDYISSQDCTFTAEVLPPTGSIQSYRIPAPPDHPHAAVDIDGGIARVAIGHTSSQVYRLQGGRTIAEGEPVTGTVVALHGASLVSATDDAPPGPLGVGWRFVGRTLSGGEWNASTGPLDGMGLHASFVWDGPSIVAALPEDESTRVRVVRSEGPDWRDLGTVDAHPTL